MSRRPARGYSDFDETDVRVRPGKSSRPRTKTRPAHNDAVTALVIGVDRGRWTCHFESHTVVCMRARELGRTPIVVGDRVRIVGDLSGSAGSLARIVGVEERSSVLRRTADDTDPYERIVVANADYLLIVCAAAEPTPRTGFVERALVAAYAGGLTPVLCMTKTDIADPAGFVAEFEALELRVLRAGTGDDLRPIEELLAHKMTALIGHSGVGKSTLVNRLVPGAGRDTAVVSLVGKGRHTSTQSVALSLPSGGWIIDTPGIRSFGLAHIHPEAVITAFADLDAAAADCPRGCTHLGAPTDPDCALDAACAPAEGPAGRRLAALRGLLTSLRTNEEWELGIDRDH